LQGKTKRGQPAEQQLGITAFLRRGQIYLLAYGFATARRDERPSENWIETARAFKRRFNIPNDVIQEETLVREMMRMTADFINEGI